MSVCHIRSNVLQETYRGFVFIHLLNPTQCSRKKISVEGERERKEGKKLVFFQRFFYEIDQPRFRLKEQIKMCVLETMRAGEQATAEVYSLPGVNRLLSKLTATFFFKHTQKKRFKK